MKKLRKPAVKILIGLGHEPDKKNITNVILTTNSNNWKKDLEKHEKELSQNWSVWVQYVGRGVFYYDSYWECLDVNGDEMYDPDPYDEHLLYDGWFIDVNGRTLNALYCVSSDKYGNTKHPDSIYGQLCRDFEEDFVKKISRIQIK